MKQLLITMCLLAGFVPVNAQNQDPPPPRKSLRIDPVALIQNKNMLEICFYQDFGEVTISIKNDSNQSVYHQVTNSSSILIDTTSWLKGLYSISIYNKDGIIKETFFHQEE